MALLELHGVCAGYGSGPDILTDITLEVEEGRSYCVIGPNGAGKSTMLKVISGLLGPREGSVVFGGKQIGGRRPDQILAAGICFVPQDRTVFPDMSVKENLTMGGYLLRDREEISRRREEVMEIFPVLAERSSQAAQSMSGGEQQMLALGRALMIEPKLMMVDEPSLGLAPQAAHQVFQTIKRLTDELGVTILMVEQNVRMGLELADHAFVLDLGSMRFEGESTAISDDPRVRDLYLGSMAPGGDGDG